ncbi:MAG: hypothetical protein N4A36_01060 [Candidatus Gracilibacteria bacterium]|jgi:hypothetical protein|nr:hypothetical protein [Candidatus Gracilibacteria bacterium]
MKSIKKLLSVVVTAAFMMVTVGTVNAAGIAIEGITHDDVAGTLTVTDTGKDYSVDNISSWKVKDSSGNEIESGNSTEAVEADGSFVITKNPGLNGLAADVYTLSFTTVGGDYNASVFVVSNANQVAVTAYVEPTLSFSIANGTDGNTAIAFGTLVPGTFSEDDVTLNYGTNAASGMTVAMASAGLVGTNQTEEIGTNDINGGAVATTATDYYKVSTAGAVGAVAFNTGTDTIGDAAGAQMSSTQDVVSTSSPSSATQSVTIGTQIAADTTADSYTDTLTFTATATF